MHSRILLRRLLCRLLQGAADPLLGQPNAIDTAEMFKHEAIVNLLKKPKASANDNADR